jgi:hypothetical protein
MVEEVLLFVPAGSTPSQTSIKIWGHDPQISTKLTVLTLQVIMNLLIADGLLLTFRAVIEELKILVDD